MSPAPWCLNEEFPMVPYSMAMQFNLSQFFVLIYTQLEIAMTMSP